MHPEEVVVCYTTDAESKAGGEQVPQDNPFI